MKRGILTVLILVSPYAWFNALARATELEGYTEPIQQSDVAFDDSGTVAAILVPPGAVVEKGQAIAKLNDEVFTQALAIAKHNFSMHGRLDSARADLSLRAFRYNQLMELFRKGNARVEETTRAESELKVARANVLAIEEEQQLRKLELDRAKAQMERRTLRAPFTGMVVRHYRNEGEYVSPNDPKILHLANVDRLRANFTTNHFDLGDLQIGNAYQMDFFESNQFAMGTLTFVSPVADAESGTISIRLEIENTEGRIRAGERCKFQTDSALPDSLRRQDRSQVFTSVNQ